jgi:hypothetical protein
MGKRKFGNLEFKYQNSPVFRSWKLVKKPNGLPRWGFAVKLY